MELNSSVLNFSRTASGKQKTAWYNFWLKGQVVMKSSSTKKSLILGGLVGTSGFLIAKAIGLIYSIPFSTILGSDAYMSYYGTAYRIYSYILNIFTAGFPFAIATMVAKYSTLENWKTVLNIRKMSLVFMACVGFLGMIIMMMLSGLLAMLMTETPEGSHVMTIVLCILAVAIFLVPILSSYRGFIQGRKEMEEYAFSQAFEQVFRVGFLLSAACLMVYGFHMDRVWALYGAVLSTSVAALAGIIQISRFSKKQEGLLKKQSKSQQVKPVASRAIFREMVILALPYMGSAILGYSDDIYNSVLLPIGLRYSSYTPDQINTVMSAANYVGTKLTSIPMILAPGFTAAIIPHLSSSLLEKKYGRIRKDVRECINIVLFLGLFLSFAIMIYAGPVFYSLFYTSDLPLSTEIVRWISLEGLMGTITPVISSIMMALSLQKSLLNRLTWGTLLKGVLLIPLTIWLGFAGAVLATMISYGYILIFNTLELSEKFGISMRSMAQVALKTILALACMGACAWLLSFTGLGSVQGSRLMCLLGLLVSGVISSLVFAGVSLVFGLPQQLFHFRLNFGHKS